MFSKEFKMNRCKIGVNLNKHIVVFRCLVLAMMFSSLGGCLGCIHIDTCPKRPGFMNIIEGEDDVFEIITTTVM